jgi:hypothetical protein
MMSDNDYSTMSESQRLRGWILMEMLRGASKAAVVLVLIGVGLYVIYLVSLVLPEESKQAPQPMGAIEAPLTALRAA